MCIYKTAQLMPAKLIMFMVLHKYQISVNSPLICRSVVSVPYSFQEIQQHGNFLLLKSQTFMERGRETKF